MTPAKEQGGGGGEGATWVKWGNIDQKRQSQGVWMWVDSEGKQMRGMYPWRGTCNDQFGNVDYAMYREKKKVKRVLISPPPDRGWDSECPNHLRASSCDEHTRGIVDGCEPRAAKCSYDFETQTFIDENGNRWATSEYNKLAD